MIIQILGIIFFFFGGVSGFFSALEKHRNGRSKDVPDSPEELPDDLNPLSSSELRAMEKWFNRPSE